MFGCDNDRLFAEKYTLQFSFGRRARVNIERAPPGHPIILLKSNKFNMAAVSVKKVYSSTMCITGLKIPTGRREPVGYLQAWPRI